VKKPRADAEDATLASRLWRSQRRSSGALKTKPVHAESDESYAP